MHNRAVYIGVGSLTTLSKCQMMSEEPDVNIIKHVWAFVFVDIFDLENFRRGNLVATSGKRSIHGLNDSTVKTGYCDL